MVGKVSSQEMAVPSQKPVLIELLRIQHEIPGLGYFLLLEDPLDSILVQNSGFKWTRYDSGWVSGLKEDFTLLGAVDSDSVSSRLNFTILSEPVADSVAVQYISQLVDRGDIDIPLAQDGPQEDLVSYALKSPYAPVYGNRFSFTADLKIFIVMGIILTFFVFSISMFIVMLVVKSRKSKKEALEKEYDQMVVDPLTNLLFEKDLDEIRKMTEADFESFFPKHLLQDLVYREVLIDRIIGLNKKMKGEFKEKLKTLYNRLGLAKVSVGKIKLSQWHIVAKGLVEINEMDLFEYLPEVKKLTNSSNFQVRSLAVSAMLNLSEKSDLSFLRDQTYPLSEWQQMKYLRIIKFVSQQRSLKIEMLFESKNKSIRIFGYKLVRILGRIDLLEMLSSIAPNLEDEEKAELLKTYLELGAHMEVDFVNSCLESKNPRLLMQAVKVAKVLGDESTLEILLGKVAEEREFTNKLQMMRSIHELDKSRFEQFISEYGNSDSDLLRVRDHILDPRLANV